MTVDPSNSGKFIHPRGTKVVLTQDLVDRDGSVIHPSGTVAVVLQSPVDAEHSYRVRFLDDSEMMVRGHEVILLSSFKEGDHARIEGVLERSGLFDRVIFRCVVGSRAYGLDDENSDTDRRGVYLPRAESHWSLIGVPEQIENDETQECYWELQKFLKLALKGNPNVLECLYSPMIEKLTPIGNELWAMRTSFLSTLVYQTYNGYVMSQFQKIQADIRNHGSIKWKHAMHLIRLLISGITMLRDGVLVTDVAEHRDRLMAIKRGLLSWEEVEAWRLNLHAEFDKARELTPLPERPDYERANQFLIRARRAALGEELP